MSVAYYSEIANCTREHVERVTGFINERLGEAHPDGGLFHADGPTDDGGWWGFDIYASDEQFIQFRDDILAPAFVHAGLGEASYRRMEVAWDSTQLAD